MTDTLSLARAFVTLRASHDLKHVSDRVGIALFDRAHQCGDLEACGDPFLVRDTGALPWLYAPDTKRQAGA